MATAQPCDLCQARATVMIRYLSVLFTEGCGHPSSRILPDLPLEVTTTPEDTLRAAGISGKRQAKYQRRMSRLLAGRS